MLSRYKEKIRSNREHQSKWRLIGGCRSNVDSGGLLCAKPRARTAEELAHFPVTTELPRDEAPYCDAVRAFYDAAARDVASYLDDGRLVAVVCEGDPLFYGSYMHLHVRLAHRFRTEVVAGVSGMSGCWSAVGTPMAQGDDVFSVLPGTLAQDELERRLNETDAVVVIKLGRNLPKVRRALERTGRLARAVYVERGTMTDERAIPLAAKADDCAPYFAIVLVPGWERRP